MEAIFFLIPLSLLLVIGAITAFVWSVNHRQFEDLDKEAYRILEQDQDLAPTDSLQENQNNINEHTSIPHTSIPHTSIPHKGA